ncbi:MAG: M20/M25/M40 family metallo-hydrolase [Flavobacteriia bacterium]|jgi:carboxypeptidase Q
MKLFFKLTYIFLAFNLFAQEDSIFIRKIYDNALSNGKSYEDLRSLCKDIGARLSGSAEAQMAVEWGEKKMKEYNFDKVYLQEIKVPHWERGTKEAAWIKVKDGSLIPIKILALGGSIGTNGIIRGKLIEFENLDALKNAKRSDVEGKIVFLNQKMNEKDINTFKAYGGCYPIRGDGAVEAAKLGAIAVVIRSLAMPVDDHPHTGSMHYDESVTKIPAAAISTKDCDLIASMENKKNIELIFEMDCRSYPDETSYNVIGELTGTEFPNEIITFGGHLDSWDAGEGAHDDGAGIVHSLEALRILKTLNYKPKHTLRVVFFMNEENGNKGGISYAKYVKEKGEKHIAALESDRGGFSPRGFSCDGDLSKFKQLFDFDKIYKPYELSEFEKGYGGVDINPLKKEFEGITLFGFVPDSQRYFDFHHAESDVFEAVNQRELELGCAAIASFIYLIDKKL